MSVATVQHSPVSDEEHSGRPQQPLLMHCTEFVAIRRHRRTCAFAAVPACEPSKDADCQLSRGLCLGMQVHPDLGDAPIQGPNEPLDSIYKLSDGMLPRTALSMCLQMQSRCPEGAGWHLG